MTALKPHMAASYSIISKRDPAWSDVRQWAYAIGAPYHVQHRLPVDSIRIDAEQRLSATKLCNQAWGIETARELAASLDGLASGGHRTPFRYRIRQYSLMRRPAIAARREELREAGPENPSALNELWRLDAVQSDWHGIRGGNLLAFDAARAVMLVRCGLVLDWLGQDDAWRYLTDMAADVQRSFG